MLTCCRRAVWRNRQLGGQVPCSCVHLAHCKGHCIMDAVCACFAKTSYISGKRTKEIIYFRLQGKVDTVGVAGTAGVTEKWRERDSPVSALAYPDHNTTDMRSDWASLISLTRLAEGRARGLVRISNRSRFLLSVLGAFWSPSSVIRPWMVTGMVSAGYSRSVIQGHGFWKSLPSCDISTQCDDVCSLTESSFNG